MTNDPKVCVIISNYNHTKYLRESIQSIVDQTYQNLDIVVVDDGSKDQEEVCKIVDIFRSDSRLRFIKQDSNYGKWNSLNTAISSTSAEFITSHDADDISLNWRIETQINTIQKTRTIHNLCGFISCWNEEEVIKNKTLPRPEQIKIAAGEDIPKMVIAGFNSPGINHYFTGNFETAGVSSMFHKKIWDFGCRFHPPGKNLRVLMSEDSDFNFRTTLFFRSTSLLLEQPYLYRRNTSTNKEEK